jgi:hypothetical protein
MGGAGQGSVKHHDGSGRCGGGGGRKRSCRVGLTNSGVGACLG